MSTTSKSVIALTIFGAIASICALIVVTALRSPVRGAVSRYAAVISDVSGLMVGNDVRISGVQVGKVESIRLDGTNARVDFSALDASPIYQNTVVAVRYQNLLGQRYLELVQPADPGPRLDRGTVISIDQTIPSFDVAKLFNGFKPLFQTLDPAQFNQLGENLLKLIQGDDTGIGPFLHDLDQISAFAVNRQAVFVTMIRNLSSVSQDLRGKSQQLFHLIATLTGVLSQLTAKVEQFRTSIDDGLPTLRDLVHLLQYTERVVDGTNRPIYDLMSRMFPQTPTIMAGLSLLPSLVQGLRDSVVEDKQATPDFTCSRGEVKLPGVGIVSFAQQNLVVCQ